ncbi:MAG: beta-propeller fold lactonase family protein, partial [Phycisphaeraceae bacterium]|nr:beta-propeller fold lactonase family protein [Phycisphaeraceae bacterium]
SVPSGTSAENGDAGVGGYYGPRGANAFLDNNSVSPYIAGLLGGADLWGLVDDDGDPNSGVKGVTFDFSSAPDDALAAVVLVDIGTDVNFGLPVDDYYGYDLLLFFNLTSFNLGNPRLSIDLGSAAGTADPLTVRGMGAFTTLTAINAHAVWATLVPDNSQAVHVNASVAGESLATTVAEGSPQYILLSDRAELEGSVPAGLGVAPDLSGLDDIVISPDGNRIYGVDASRDALVVINTGQGDGTRDYVAEPIGSRPEDGSQRQLFLDGDDAVVNGLAGARAITIDSDGDHVYVAGTDEGKIAIFRTEANGDLTFVQAINRSGVQTVQVNDTDTRVYVGRSGSITRYTRNDSTGYLSGAYTKPIAGGVYEIAFSSDGSLVYALNSSNNGTLTVLNSNLNTVYQTITGLGGGGDMAVSADDFVYVTGQSSNTLSVFVRNGNTLSLVQTIENGVEGVNGLVEPSDVTLTQDETYLLVTGKVSNAIAVFQRNAASGKLQFVQVVRNNMGGTEGLRAPSAMVIDPNSGLIFAGSLGNSNFNGGLVIFTNLADGNVLPEPGAILTSFDHIEALGVSTAGGEDLIALVNAPEAEVTITTISTGGKNDIVVLQDQSPATVVNLGAGDDEAHLRSNTAGASVTVNGNAGSDTINVLEAGVNTSTVINGGIGVDTIKVSGMNLPSSASVTVHGDNPVHTDPKDDRLLFDPEDPTPLDTPNYTIGNFFGAGALSESGDIRVDSPSLKGLVTFDTVDLQVISPPLFTSINTPTISEGGSVTFSVTINTLGNSLDGELLWDIDGDGQFGDVSGPDLDGENGTAVSASISLTWEQLVDLGLNDGDTPSGTVYHVGVRATNDLGFSSEEFATLTILNSAPDVPVSGNSTVNLGDPYVIHFSAADDGDDRVWEWRVVWGDDGGNHDAFGSGDSSATHVYEVPATYIVQVSAVDEDGVHAGNNTVTVNVGVQQSQVYAGGPYTIAEGEDLVLAAVAPGSSTPSFAWDIDGDGVFDDAIGPNPTVLWDDLQGLTNPVNDNSGNPYDIRVRATYSGFGSVISAPAAVLTITNTAPTATLSNNGPVDEGSTTATISFTSQFDESDADTTAGFTYSYDFDNDGGFDLITSVASVTVPSSLVIDDGRQIVRAVISDKDGGSTELFTDLIIENVAPTLNLAGVSSVDEGASYSLNLSATDPGNDAILQWIVDWDDGTVETFDGATQALTHGFSDNGVRTVLVTAIDEDGLYTATQVVDVTNVAPELQGLAATTITENEFSHFTGTIVDPGVEDSFTLAVTWGDGSVIELFTLSAGATDFEFTHRYLDDESGTPSLPDDYTINATVTDDDLDSGIVSTTVTVNNLAPTVGVLGLASGTVGETETVDLFGYISDAGPLDTHVITIDWGDGSSSAATVDQVNRTFFAAHEYDDDMDTPPLQPEDDFTITATVTDDDDDSNSLETTVTIATVAPFFTSAFVAPEEINENETITVSGTFDDVSLLDTHTMLIDWGDGTATTLAEGDINQIDRSFEATHLYIDDNPTVTSTDDYIITATLTDDDGGASTLVIPRVVPHTLGDTSVAEAAIATARSGNDLTGVSFDLVYD